MTSPHTIRNHSLRESEAALPPGRWVTRGAIKVYEPDQSAIVFTDDDISTNAPEQGVWDTIAANLNTITPISEPETRALCDDCGCLIKPAERCPRCLVWALKDEELWSWGRQRFANRHIVWDILDARKSVAA